MNCRRCQGCMTQDHFVDLLESGGEWWTQSWRCINCGYVLDPVLEQNRQKQQVAITSATVPAVTSSARQVESLLDQADRDFDIAA